MITLYLVDKGILKQPVLYLSDFLERHRSHYYDHLMRTRERNDIAQWFKFFLVGVAETARSGIATFDAILRLQKEMDARLETLGRKMASGRKLLTALYEQPVIWPDRVAKATDLSLPSAYSLIKDMERLGILKEITGARRDKAYRFDDYLNIFKT
jgi:Fic family protein